MFGCSRCVKQIQQNSSLPTTNNLQQQDIQEQHFRILNARCKMFVDVFTSISYRDYCSWHIVTLRH